MRRRASSPSARVPACQSSLADADSDRTSVRRSARSRNSPQNEVKADDVSEDSEEDEEACFHDAREVVDDEDDDDEEVVELTEVPRGKSTGKGGNTRVSPRRTGRSGAAQQGFVLKVTTTRWLDCAFIVGWGRSRPNF